ncbi:MAG: AfsA-related hotdog domain-containing protein [Nitrospirota bacterium]|nr:AfsA-related hotdog domain-containing protein [Nitrospirota bacterium]
MKDRYASAKSKKIGKKYVHKHEESNVLISDIIHRNDLGSNIYECFIAFDENLPFFFEHPVDHLPGLLLIEAARQMGIAVVHQFYGIGQDTYFILDRFFSRFYNFVEFELETILRITVNEFKEKSRKGNGEFTGVICVIQNNKILAEFEIIGNCISKKIVNRFRKRNLLQVSTI